MLMLGWSSQRWRGSHEISRPHYVKEAADRALKRICSRTQRQKEWKLTEDTRDPTLQHIMTRIADAIGEDFSMSANRDGLLVRRKSRRKEL